MTEPFGPFPRLCVVDASVIIKTCLPEEDSDLAVALLQGTGSEHVRAVPDLAYLECSNVLWKWVRQGRLTTEIACESASDLLALLFDAYSHNGLTESALELALALNISVYDGAYVALAVKLSAPLITADEALARRAGEAGHDVRLLHRFRWIDQQ